MSYRDWGRGEDGPRERRSVARWDEPAGAFPADPYSVDAEGYRTPSRRRAIERGQQEPAETYLPRWALESGVRSADGGGRHAAPDDDDIAPPSSGGDWRTPTDTGNDWGTGGTPSDWRTGGSASDWRANEPGRDWGTPGSTGDWRTGEGGTGWRRVAETSWREVPAIEAGPASDHTREWTFDRPQEQGYVGSRRADDDPVSAIPPQSRPRRTPSRQQPVIWSGGEEESTGGTAEPEVERPSRRARWASAEPWARPSVDPWERSAEPDEPAYRPAVDPWDASGMHAWQPAAGADRWDRTSGTGRWDEPDSTAQWHQPDSTGQWHQPDSTGQWDRYPDEGWDRTAPPRSVGPAGPWSWPGQDGPEEGFWSGTRLAGDDPRWVDAPVSAPRSPVVGYTAPRPRSAPRRADPVGSSRAGTPTAVRRADPAAWSRRLEDDLLDPDQGGSLRPLLYTAACYLLPAVMVFFWLLTLDGQAPAGCVTDISGGGCDSPRSRALGSMLEGMPRFGLALASSLVVALLLRRVGTTWRSTTVALAAAVVGGGLSTVMISAITGQPIG
ncbi:hypothetical protein Q3W71_28290 [Micromonospora sp. C28SCA-DRY-2]|uniref:hypothetical protein n=1 Tax=Micromonospora sp. C28SCA-DRY-2 TaxID=3059522 RepID=UPI00267540E9|nr:hypothetical protein [Micromonospora sp. C28SCA-DRY-2]MDO3705575.1 hypothetical protein [Micromonospora sp. C28SCA-DRY-2]